MNQTPGPVEQPDSVSLAESLQSDRVRADASKAVTMRNGAATSRPPSRPGTPLIVFGVIYPAIVIAIELASRMCAEAILDPMPTVWHVALVAFVPAMNYVVWTRRERPPTAALAMGVGAAMAIALSYAVVFLPLLPLAVVGIVVYGIGLLPLAPLVTFGMIWRQLARLLRQPRQHGIARAALVGFAAGMAALALGDIQVAATRLAVGWTTGSDAGQRSRGLTLLRTVGSETVLHGLCHSQLRRPVGPLNALLSWATNTHTARIFEFGAVPADTVSAAEAYFRAYGRSCTASRPPRPASGLSISRTAAFDRDLGGAMVGGAVDDLALTASRIEGSIAADDAVAYLEWTFEFGNTGQAPSEARFEIALPPGGVVSRATLWVDGQEREAAYGARGHVRAAYEKVAVRQRRDPLLVTSRGGDRVFAQAFPVPARGALKLKIGITAPLDLADLATARLVLPAILESNFAADRLLTRYEMESRAPLSILEARGAAALLAGANLLQGAFDTIGSAAHRTAIMVARGGGSTARLAHVADGTKIVQEFAEVVAKDDPLLIVIDGSASVGSAAAGIADALALIRRGRKVGLIIAADGGASLPLAPWTPDMLGRAQRLLHGHVFRGGEDNSAALAAAIEALGGEPSGRILWIHGPQPVPFKDAAAVLARASAVRADPPALLDFPVVRGANLLLPDTPWGWSARLVPSLGTVPLSLEAELRPTPRIELVRRETAAADAATMTAAGAPKGSNHIVRLWAKDRVAALIGRGAETTADARAAAVALASTHHLVTPVSGAVVLETARQFEEAQLAPAARANVPTLPEPHEWALLTVSGLALLWLARQRRAVAAGGAGG